MVSIFTLKLKLASKINRMILCIAGGDGSLIGILKAASDAGVQIDDLPAVALPYGTGNDLARVSNWGGTPSGSIYRDVPSIVKELCENTEIKDFNVWNVQVRMREDGDIYDVNS
jgi:Diacylglycerol kinase catalytic domain